jgi:hypothetical protein
VKIAPVTNVIATRIRPERMVEESVEVKRQAGIAFPAGRLSRQPVGRITEMLAWRTVALSYTANRALVLKATSVLPPDPSS